MLCIASQHEKSKRTPAYLAQSYIYYALSSDQKSNPYTQYYAHNYCGYATIHVKIISFIITTLT